MAGDLRVTTAHPIDGELMPAESITGAVAPAGLRAATPARKP